MSLTAEQCKAVEDAKSILQGAGVAIVSHILADVFAHSVQNIDIPKYSNSQSVSPPLFPYLSPLPSFSPVQSIRVTRNWSSAVNAVIDHPIGAILEYPQSGSCEGESIAHQLAIDPRNFVNPRKNMQYTIEMLAGHHNVRCLLISKGVDSSKGALCYQAKASCKCSSSQIWIC